MHDAELFVQVGHALQDLAHHDLDFQLLVESNSQAAAFTLDVLRKRHVHHFEDDVQTPVFILDALSFHHVRAVGAAAHLVDFIEPLQNLNLTLLERLLLCLELVLEALDGIVLPSLDMATFVDVAETAAANQLLLLVLAEQYGLSFG